jgi:glycine dehydrogenase subunit 1
MRYLPLTQSDREAMLLKIGVSTIDELFKNVPGDKLLSANLNLPTHQGEWAVERHLQALASQNVTASSVPFFIGAGAYKHHVPATIDHLIQRSEFLTAYTPYQPEIAQGTLQVLFEFQSQVCALTGMEVANASMYDGSTAAAEAVAMAGRVTKRKKALLAGNLHPHYQDTIETFARLAGEETLICAANPASAEDLLSSITPELSCVVVQTPDVFGHLYDLKALAEKAHSVGALLVVVVTEVLSLGAMEPPGAMGADIVVAEGQSLGNSLMFGGPYVGLFATREKFIRQMPGRLCGETVDAEGRRGFVLTLSTREQHIRRDKATSNICTNAGLCCLAFSIHLSLLGQKGLEHLAHLNHAKACTLADKLKSIKGIKLLNQNFFNEFTLELSRPAAPLIEALAAEGIMAGVPYERLRKGQGENLLIVASTEINTDEDQDQLVAALKRHLQAEGA